jgi:hypothetical protein
MELGHLGGPSRVSWQPGLGSFCRCAAGVGLVGTELSSHEYV